MKKKNINEIYSEWKEMKSRIVKESTMSTYVTNAERHILPVFGQLEKVTEHDVQTFVFKLMEDGLNVKTVKDILIILKMIVRHGMKTGAMDWCEWDVVLPKTEENKDIKVLTLGEQKRMMNFLKKHFSFRNLGLYICLCTGMRIGEICALKWSDICIEQMAIKVNRTIERVYVIDNGRKYTKLIIGSPKTRSSKREIPIGGELIRMLRPIRHFMRDDFYILTNNEKPLEPRIYRHYYKNFMAGMGMSDIKFHGLRHTFATRCIESNCDYKTISSILGHANISTTLNLYVHPDIGQKRKCIDKMLRTVK